MDIINFDSRDQERYGELKTQIKQGWLMFAQGILEVRQKKLYRIEYDTFEEFCGSELGISRRRGYQLMEAVEVIENVKNFTHLPNESQAREIAKAKVAPQLQSSVWNEVVETNKPEEITAKKVQEVVSEWAEADNFLKDRMKEQSTPSVFVQPTPMSESEILAKAKEIRRLKMDEVNKRREEIRNTVKAEVLDAGDKSYRVFYADPPWSYGNTMPEYVTDASDHYPLMPLEDICALPVKDIAEDNAVLFMWTTSPHLEESFEVVKAWGFKYKTSFVWDKIKHNMGHYNSVRHEMLLVCTRGACTPDVKKLFDSVVSIERTEHSRKPEYFREIIDTIYTHGNKIELFSRTNVEGWDLFGNQKGKYNV